MVGDDHLSKNKRLDYVGRVELTRSWGLSAQILRRAKKHYKNGISEDGMEYGKTSGGRSICHRENSTEKANSF